MIKHICMLHLVEKSQVYLGSIGIETEDATEDGVQTLIAEWFNEFKQESGDPVMFIDWLTTSGKATEESWCDEAPNTPIQVYLGDVVPVRGLLYLFMKADFDNWYKSGDFDKWLQDSASGISEEQLLEWLRKRIK